MAFEAAFATTLKLACKNPEAVKASLEPDIKNNETSQTEIIAHLAEDGTKSAAKTDKTRNKSFVEIRIKSKKLSHMKAIVNSYLSAVQMLNEVEEKIVAE